MPTTPNTGFCAFVHSGQLSNTDRTRRVLWFSIMQCVPRVTRPLVFDHARRAARDASSPPNPDLRLHALAALIGDRCVT
ncbi:hypothetical protein PF005_g28276 [Phytophthora fragariae]|uniref:Uncharacterized protein n=1 Tax=Phytophthora fragariae TaxID=53985 RepID=A0A6A3HAW9_9STRA|nr:hypothetical protein PF011_g28053 [Phytophthora fragariae]KAE9064970.1 hypothetical protein PF010_g28405 [Phytophthora fragariae]KAE9168673.1 hypothetical protein PF005_g28276 [Phytophthora fragariae]KAE9170524.1 hypothetical protein PF004_g27845 [Phytophthora fragariae]KAE9175139.1 hypothetical protein PF002_g28866 [Phytophthora fragariae]